MARIRPVILAALVPLAACSARAPAGRAEAALVRTAPMIELEGVGTEIDRCAFATDGVADVLAGFELPDDDALRARAEIALDRHHVAHGWGGWLGGRSPIPFTPEPACDARALALVAEAALACADERLAFERWKVAAVLERNGRGAEAAKLAPHTRLARASEWPERQLRLARAAAAEGRWAEAYYHASNYNPWMRCGNAGLGAARRRNQLAAWCLTQLERWEDLRALCRSALEDEWIGTPCFAEPLVESYRREGRPDLAEDELAALIASPNGFGAEALERSLAHREILSLAPVEAAERLREIACGFEDHRYEAADILRRAGPATIRRWIAELEGSEWSATDSLYASWLAETGLPEVGAALERWTAAEPDLLKSYGFAHTWRTWRDASAARAGYAAALSGE